MKTEKIKKRKQPPEKQQFQRFVLMFFSFMVALAISYDAMAQGGLLGRGHECDEEESSFQELLHRNGTSSIFSNQGFGGANGGVGNQGFGGANGGVGNQGFGGGNGDIGNQGFGANQGGITNQGFGEGAPLGSGLIVLMIAGVGYATIRRERKDEA